MEALEKFCKYGMVIMPTSKGWNCAVFGEMSDRDLDVMNALNDVVVKELSRLLNERDNNGNSVNAPNGL